MVGARVRKIIVVRPHLFGSRENCFFRSFSRESFSGRMHAVRFMRSGRDGSDCKMLHKLRFRGPPFTRDGLMEIVGKTMLSITMSVQGNSPAFKRRMTIRLARSGRHRFFVPHKFTRKFDMLDSRIVFRCGYSGFCTPRDRKTVT